MKATGETFGEEGVQRLVARCAKRQIADYRSGIPARLEALSSIRNEEGFMAEVQRQRDGSFLRNPFGIFPAVALRLCALASLR